jgi:hypothetical protein
MKRLIVLCVLFATLTAAGATAARTRTPMDLGQWSKTGGGGVSLDGISYTDGEDRKVSGKILRADPWAGLFVLPSLAIVGNLHVQSPFGNHFVDRPDVLGFTAGVRYYKQLYHFYGYVGLQLGGLIFSRTGDEQNLKIHAEGLNQDTRGFMATAPLGVLFPLSRNLAVELGMRVHSIWLSEGAHWVEYSVGYLGVFWCF